MMRIFVMYNREGEILSVSKVEVMPEHLNQPFAMVDENEFVIEVPMKEEFLKIDAIQLHEKYKVDAEQKKLIKKA